MRSVLGNLQQSLGDLFSALRVQLCAALSVAPDSGSRGEESDPGIDPDFEGWIRNDPMVTGNPASRYRSQPPGYLTSNGRRSLEIGAAED